MTTHNQQCDKIFCWTSRLYCTFYKYMYRILNTIEIHGPVGKKRNIFSTWVLGPVLQYTIAPWVTIILRESLSLNLRRRMNRGSLLLNRRAGWPTWRDSIKYRVNVNSRNNDTQSRTVLIVETLAGQHRYVELKGIIILGEFFNLFCVSIHISNVQLNCYVLIRWKLFPK